AAAQGKRTSRRLQKLSPVTKPTESSEPEFESGEEDITMTTTTENIQKNAGKRIQAAALSVEENNLALISRAKEIIRSYLTEEEDSFRLIDWLNEQEQKQTISTDLRNKTLIKVFRWGK